MRTASAWFVALTLLLASAVLLADDHSVIFDEDVDFSIFKTFTMREVRMTSARPELNFPAVVKDIGDAMRTSLTALGLKETDTGAELVVECQVSGKDFNIGPWGRPNTVGPGTGGGGGRGRAPSSAPVDFTEVTMVLDLIRADANALVFRGVYHDTEENPEKLVKALPKDAATLLAQYPRKKKD
jgi:hypothetical protein